MLISPYESFRPCIYLISLPQITNLQQKNIRNSHMYAHETAKTL